MPVILYGLLEQRPGHPNLGLPFYIGIGTRYRPYRHFALARSIKKHTNQALQGVLEAHFAMNIDPTIHIYETFADNAEAFVAEIATIARYGRMAFEIGGILCNLAPGGQSTNPEAQRLSWLDEGIRTKRIAAMKGIKKTDTPAGRAARLANARVPKSEEALAASRDAAVRNWSDPAFREQRSVNQTAAWEDPEKRTNMLKGRSEAQAKLWTNPDVRKKRTTGVSASVKNKWDNDPEYAAKARAGLKSAWDDPEKKAARVAKMLASRAAKRGVRQTPEKSAGRTANMKAINASMTAEDRSAIQANAWADPEVAAARKAGLKAAAQNSELKAARISAMLSGKRRKAAERAAKAQSMEGCGH